MNTFRAQLPDGFNLPKRLSRLGELAYNLWWTWQPEAARVFGRLDYDLWERLGHNPIRLLRDIERPRLSQASRDPEYRALYDRVFADFDSYMNQTDTWTRQAHRSKKRIAAPSHRGPAPTSGCSPGPDLVTQKLPE